MSGVFGPVAQIQVPDFAATQMRAQELAMRRQAMQQQNAVSDFFRQNAQGFASPDAAKRMNLLAMLAQQGGQGAAMALPMLDQERRREELRRIMNDEPMGGAPAAQPAAMPAVAAPAPAGAENPQWNDRSLPRGIRNNNPLNLSYVSGQPGVQGSDGRFGRYNTPEEGIAAATRQLQMYGARGLTTPAQIIGRWAPPNENNTQAYVAAVARNAGLDPNQPVNLQDPAVVSRLVAAMAQHENGRPVPMDVVQRGVQMGLGGARPAAGGDTIPAQAAAPGAPPSAAPVANNDARIATLMRRAERLAAAGYQQEAQTTLALIQSLRRGEAPRMVEVRTDEGIFMVDPTNPQNRVRVGGAPEGAPRSPERMQQDRELAEAGAARSTTTVNAGDRRTDVLIADAWKASEDTAVSAGRRAALFNRAEQAMQTFQPGVLAERRIWLGQLARELGVRSPSTSEGEVLRQVQRQLELATTPQGQGAITENERGLIRDAIPVLLTTPEGARQAIAMIRRLDDYEMQIARIYRQNARRNGGQPNAVSVREEIAAFIEQNQPPDVQALLDNLSGPAPSAPSGAQADPPSSVPPPPRGFRIVQ